MNRRAFLRPHSLAEATGQLLGAFDEVALKETESRPESFAIVRAACRAMATNFELLLPFGTPQAHTMAACAFEEIERLEQQLSVYRESSEVSRLNHCAPLAAVPVESGLFDLLALAARITSETAGAFDISAGALVKAWGFYRGPRKIPSAVERDEALEQVGMRHVALDHERQTVRYHRPKLEINLGSIGKGYALDRVAKLLRERWELSAGLLHGGHSSVYAIGTEPGEQRGWAVGIQHPWDAGRRLAVVRLHDRALGTSAATFQHLEYEGRKLGHILDPRTGWPAQGIASASVVSDTAAEADALATAFFILGVDKARDYCDAHPRVGALLLPQDSTSPVVLGLSPDDLSLVP